MRSLVRSHMLRAQILNLFTRRWSGCGGIILVEDRKNVLLTPFDIKRGAGEKQTEYFGSGFENESSIMHPGMFLGNTHLLIKPYEGLRPMTPQLVASSLTDPPMLRGPCV